MNAKIPRCTAVMLLELNLARVIVMQLQRAAMATTHIPEVSSNSLGQDNSRIRASFKRRPGSGYQWILLKIIRTYLFH